MLFIRKLLLNMTFQISQSRTHTNTQTEREKEKQQNNRIRFRFGACSYYRSMIRIICLEKTCRFCLFRYGQLAHTAEVNVNKTITSRRRHFFFFFCVRKPTHTALSIQVERWIGLWWVKWVSMCDSHSTKSLKW